MRNGSEKHWFGKVCLEDRTRSALNWKGVLRGPDPKCIELARCASDPRQTKMLKSGRVTNRGISIVVSRS